jgi:putative DNA-invertase from lambdoid prophage Rac
MKTIIYTRVSTDTQNHDSQLQELREYCARRGWTEVEEITDTISGTKSRAGLDRLMALVRRGKVDIVVCFKLDRLGRSLSHLAALIGEFTAHNVALVVPAQGIDTSGANSAARLQLNILCAVAEFERDLIRERTLAGLVAARKRGARLGRPRSIDQYRSQVLELKGRGMSRRAIAGELGIPASNVGRLLAKAA